MFGVKSAQQDIIKTFLFQDCALPEDAHPTACLAVFVDFFHGNDTARKDPHGIRSFRNDWSPKAGTASIAGQLQ